MQNNSIIKQIGTRNFFICLTLVILSITLSFIHTNALAIENDNDSEDEQIIEEFFVTETVYSQEKGEVQFTFKPVFFDDTLEGDLLELGITTEYGITDNLQTEVSWVGYQNINPGSEGIGDFEFGLKYTFNKLEKLGLEIATGFEVSVPSGDIDKDLTEGFIFYEPFVIFSKDLINNANLHFDLAYGIADRVKEADEEGISDDMETIETALGIGNAIRVSGENEDIVKQIKFSKFVHQ